MQAIKSPLGQKISKLNTLSIVIALAVAAIGLLVYTSALEHAELIESREAQASLLAKTCQAALSFRDADAADEALDVLESTPSIIRAYVLDDSGRPFASYHRSAQPRLLTGSDEPATWAVRQDKGTLSVEQKIEFDGQTIGTVLIVDDMSTLTGKFWTHFYGITVCLLIAVLLSRIITFRLQMAMTRPIAALTSTMEQVRQTKEYDLRCPAGPRDETGFLIEGFNAMLAEIQSRDATIREARDELEERVLQRTADLEEEISERKRLHYELTISEEANRMIVENAFDAIIIVNSAGLIDAWNPQADRLFGRSKSEVLGRHLADVILPADLRDEFKEKLENYIRSRESDIVNHARETSCLRHDGEQFSAEFAISPSMIHGNLFFCVFVRDITERKRAEKELSDARDRALELAKLKSEFLANMSHEIRTPMNGVIGMTDLLLGTELTEEQADYAVTIKNSSDALLGVINDILDISKIEAGKLSIEEIPFSMRALVEGVSEILAGSARQKGIEIIAGVSPRVPDTLLGDPTRLRQILTNFAANAVKFTEEGEVVIGVELVDQVDLDCVLRVSVSDTGVGIPESALEAIFDSFTQVDGSTTRRFGGTGLGLSISQKLVHLMNGNIGVSSTVGKGSLFWFEVPLKKADEGLLPIEASSSIDLEHLRVLIVDDNNTNRVILREYINSWKGRPTCVGSATEAMIALRSSVDDPFKLIIMDMQMPDLDGLLASRTIKNDPLIPDANIIMLSSIGEYLPGDVMSEYGIAARLSKPVKRSSLHEAVCRVLHKNGPSAKTQASGSIVETSKSSRRLKMLLAEDNVVNQKVAVHFLKRLGHEVVYAATGADAVYAAKREPFDLIFMDVQMPVMDGLEATRCLKAWMRENDREIPIIAMTAHAMAGDKDRCLEAGMSDYLTKPLRIDELRSVIERWAPPGEEESEAA